MITIEDIWHHTRQYIFKDCLIQDQCERFYNPCNIERRIEDCVCDDFQFYLDYQINQAKLNHNDSFELILFSYDLDQFKITFPLSIVKHVPLIEQLHKWYHIIDGECEFAEGILQNVKYGISFDGKIIDGDQTPWNGGVENYLENRNSFYLCLLDQDEYFTSRNIDSAAIVKATNSQQLIDHKMESIKLAELVQYLKDQISLKLEE